MTTYRVSSIWPDRFVHKTVNDYWEVVEEYHMNIIQLMDLVNWEILAALSIIENKGEYRMLNSETNSYNF